MSNLAQINVLFRADLGKFSTEMQSATRQLQKTGKQMQEIGKQMSTYITAPLVALGGFSSKISMDFDDSMRKVMATTNATEVEFKSLQSTAEQMGAQTRYSASEAAEAMNYMALAGWKSQQIIEGIPGVLSLAAASGEGLGLVSDILTDGLTAMGKGAGDAAQFVDVLAAASSNSNTTVGMLGQAFAYAAPLAGSLGYQVEDLALAIGLMSNAGIKGEKAGTAIRSILTRLVKPTRESKKAMDELGISVTNADGSMRPLSDVLGDLRVKFQNLTQSQRAQYAGMLAGQEALSGFLALVNAGPEDFDKLSKAINNSTGTAKRMSDQMEGGIGGSWREMKSALEGVSIQIGQVLEPVFKSMTKTIKDLSNWFMGLSDEWKKAIVVIGGVAAAIGPVLISLGAMLKLLPLLGSAFVAVKMAVLAFNAALLANPIGMVTVLLTGLASSVLIAELGFKSLLDTESNLNDISKEVSKSTSKQITELKALVKIAKNVKESDQNRIDAIAKINAISPEYLSNITKESINTNSATVAINKYVAALKNKAEQMAIASKKEQLYQKLIEEETKPIEGGFKFGDGKIVRNREDLEKYIKVLNLTGAAANLVRADYSLLIDKREKDISLLKEQISYMDKFEDAKKREAEFIKEGVTSGYAKSEKGFDLFEEYKKNPGGIVEEKVDSGGGGGKSDSKFLKGSIDFYEAQIKGLEQLRSATSTTKDEYLAFGEKIEEIQKKIDAISASREKATAITMGFEPIPENTITSYERLIAQKKEDIKVMEIGSFMYQALKNEITDLEFTLKAKVDEASFDSAVEGMKRLQQEVELQSQIASDAMEEKAANAAMWGSIVGSTFEQVGGLIIDSMGEASSALAQFGQDMAAIVIKVMAMAISQSMSEGVVIAANAASGMGPIGAFALPAIITSVLGAIMGAHSKVPKFADGGIVSGPTFGLMGEYAGAANNPEVIAPLNKLKDLIEPANAGGDTYVTLGGGFKLTGSDLQLVLDRNTTRSKRVK